VITLLFILLRRWRAQSSAVPIASTSISGITEEVVIVDGD
jgi:hypothetical protein